MCGIAGRFSVETTLDRASVEEVAAMTEAIRHRGPDSGALLDRTPVAVLGHRRLAIIDVATGQQPMASGDGNLWITFNGEIYNYRTLRSELQARGHTFRTSSDTEVILAAYREWDTQAPERLDGMYAFALLDLPRRRLFLARDHLGKKPLYLHFRRGVLDFASELSALRLASDWRGDIDPTALAFYLRLGYVPAPWTIYREVAKLRPGEWCLVDARGLSRHRYWDLGMVGPERALTAAEAVDAIDAELGQAVRARLMSEVPLGAFLSGGIDSGLVVGLMAEAMGPGVRTVTVGFAGEPSETEVARMVASHHRSDHVEYTVDPEVHPLMTAVQQHFGEPFADSSAYPTWHVSRVARSAVTVALTGDGGDESFGGYDFRVWPHLRDARVRRFLPGAAPRWLFRCLAATWPSRHDLPRPLRLGTMFRNLGTEEDRAYYLDLCFTAPTLADAIAPELAPEGRRVEEHVREIYRSGWRGDPLQAMMRADASLYLPENGLVKVDRMSMAHGLEVRSPLLSRRLVELAFAIPASLKVAGGVSKALLRKVAERHLPREVVSLPKRGFHIPLDRWLREELRPAFEADVLVGPGSDTEGMDTRVIRRLWAEHQRGAFNHGHTLWMLWSLQAWLRTHRARTAPAPPRRADLADVA